VTDGQRTSGDGKADVGTPASVGSGATTPEAPRSRRGLLTGLGAVGAGVTAALVLHERSAAAQIGGALVLGVTNVSDFPTTLQYNGGSGLLGSTTAGIVVDSYGLPGVVGASDVGAGVFGTSATGIGVQGATSNGQSAVAGVDSSGGSGGTGVLGTSTDGTGVSGTSTNGTGVQGVTYSEVASGVAGLDFSGYSTGVTGTSTNGTGVSGTSTNGNGLTGTSTNGTGVYAASTGGVALVVSGPATFSMSGVVTIPPGETFATISVNGVTPTSLVLATVQKLEIGVVLAGAVPSTNSITIYLQRAPTGPLPVAWFVIG
jgi:hypothetical protein